MQNVRFIQILLLAGSMSLPAGRSAFSQGRSDGLDLRGPWKFELGDDPDRPKPDYDDRNWVTINVPGSWEDQGFPGYDGFAWYRRSFRAPASWKDRPLSLHLGHIDDADEVYINGVFLNFQGAMPPHFMTAYDVERSYPLPPSLLNFEGKNVIAVRVYDEKMSGGIVRGDVSIQVAPVTLVPDQPLQGATWKFATGDDMARAHPGYNDKSWPAVRVPGVWETQGFKEYDGYGWYRVRFRVSSALLGRRLILLLGKIDDVDEVFLNGHRIGGTGSLRSDGPLLGEEYNQLRAYSIPSDRLLTGSDNVVAVRVYDRFMHGGIWDGPIGLIDRERYLLQQEGRKGGESWLRRLMDALFR